MVIFFFGDRFFPGVERRYLLLSLLIIPFIFFSSFISHILLGLQKIKKFNILFFFQGFSLFILLLVFLPLLHFGVGGAILAYIISFIFYGVVLYFTTKKETGAIVFKFRKEYFKNLFSYGLKIYPSHIFSFLNYRINMFLINIILNPTAVGFYSVATGLSEGLWVFSESIGTVLLPKVASETDSERLKKFTPFICRNVLLGLLIIIILLFFLSRWLIVFLYSEKFLDSIAPFQILLFGTLAIGGWEILSSDIAARGKPLINSYITGVSLVLNIILNVLLIPKYGIIGAAWSSTFSYFFMFLIVAFIYSKISMNNFKDVIFLKQSDIQLYKNFLKSIKKT
jgi:O-antigen/teichoic acid export membrane protein